MKELQSIEAPISVQKRLVGSARTNDVEPRMFSFLVINDDHSSITVDETRSTGTECGINVLAYNKKQQTTFDKVHNWLRFDDPQIEVGPLKLEKDIASTCNGFDEEIEFQPPEEESLIMVDDPVKTQSLMLMSAGNSTKGEFLYSNAPVEKEDRVAAPNSIFKDMQYVVGQKCPHFVHDPYNMMEPEILFCNLHAQISPQQFHPPTLSHRRPLFHPLDSHPAHINSHMRFMDPDDIIRHDGPPNHRVGANMHHPPFHYPSPGLTGFDVPIHHPTLQQMQMAGNFPPSYLLHEVPRVALLSSHPNNQATSFMQK